MNFTVEKDYWHYAGQNFFHGEKSFLKVGENHK